jgi:uncharacterized membrane protein YdfJ with MMPL/SSD domain
MKPVLFSVAEVVDGACRIPGHYDDYLWRVAVDSQGLQSCVPGGFLHTVVVVAAAAVVAVVLGARTLTAAGLRAKLERVSMRLGALCFQE